MTGVTASSTQTPDTPPSYSGLGVSLAWLLVAVVSMLVAAFGVLLGMRHLAPELQPYVALPLTALLAAIFLPMYRVNVTTADAAVRVSKRSLGAWLVRRPTTRWSAPISDIAWIRVDKSPWDAMFLAIGTKSHGSIRFAYKTSKDDPQRDFARALVTFARDAHGLPIAVLPNIWETPARRGFIWLVAAVCAAIVPAAFFIPTDAKTQVYVALGAMVLAGYAIVLLFKKTRQGDAS